MIRERECGRLVGPILVLSALVCMLANLLLFSDGQRLEDYYTTLQVWLMGGLIGGGLSMLYHRTVCCGNRNRVRKDVRTQRERELDIEYKELRLKKVKLEIKKLEKEVGPLLDPERGEEATGEEHKAAEGAQEPPQEAAGPHKSTAGATDTHTTDTTKPADAVPSNSVLWQPQLAQTEERSAEVQRQQGHEAACSGSGGTQRGAGRRPTERGQLRAQPHTSRRFYGLINQGSTCYLNSVLQVLFMTRGFREAVERPSRGNDSKLIDGPLRHLFNVLKVKTASTRNITDKLEIYSVYEQRDAAEHFEKILNMTSPEASQIFHGQLVHETICSTCHNQTDREAPFWYLPLQLVDSYQHYRVLDGIETHFRDSSFSGANQMDCHHCFTKSDATTKHVLTCHPEVLVLLLKRFQLNYSFSKYVKNNCTVVVPLTLHIPPNKTYELYATVDHCGSLQSGHYTSTIRSQEDNKWYRFNDSSVTLLDYQPFQVDEFQRSSDSYLLFYKKKNGADTGTPVSTPLTCAPAAILGQRHGAPVDRAGQVELAEEAADTEAYSHTQDTDTQPGTSGDHQDNDWGGQQDRMATGADRDKDGRRRASTEHLSEDRQGSEGLVRGNMSENQARAEEERSLKPAGPDTEVDEEMGGPDGKEEQGESGGAEGTAPEQHTEQRKGKEQKKNEQKKENKLWSFRPRIK